MCKPLQTYWFVDWLSLLPHPGSLCLAACHNSTNQWLFSIIVESGSCWTFQGRRSRPGPLYSKMTQMSPKARKSKKSWGMVFMRPVEQYQSTCNMLSKACLKDPLPTWPWLHDLGYMPLATWYCLHDLGYMPLTTWPCLHDLDYSVHDLEYTTLTTWPWLHDLVYMTLATCPWLHDLEYMPLSTWPWVHDLSYLTLVTWPCLNDLVYVGKRNSGEDEESLCVEVLFRCFWRELWWSCCLLLKLDHLLPHLYMSRQFCPDYPLLTASMFLCTLGALSSIIGLYISVILVIGKFVRVATTGLKETIMFNSLPAVDRIYNLCMDIYLVRETCILYLEEELFAKLLFLYRSTETMIAFTRPPKQKQD